MAPDGSTVAALTAEFNKRLLDGHISKIAQTEKDELILTVKSGGEQIRLLMSVNPSLPVIYITGDNKQSPVNAPAFCMLLRKHIQGGKIVKISQPSMERIIDFEIEHYDEMGDLRRKTLTCELMGKHSNVIFRDGTRIIDSIKHVSRLVSSVREVLPSKEYFIPFSDEKIDPFIVCGFEKNRPDTGNAQEPSKDRAPAALKNNKAVFEEKVFGGSVSLSKTLYLNITGVSPQLSQEILYRAEVDSERPATDVTKEEKERIWAAFSGVIKRIAEGDFAPEIVYEKGKPAAFSPFEFKIYDGFEREKYESVSKLLYDFYSKRQKLTVMRQKTTDLRQIVQGLLSKDYKKYDLQLKQLKDTEKKDKYKVYGEILTAYGYSIEPKATSYKGVDFYSGKEITIPLDPALSAIDNAKKYFGKYSKLKRTQNALIGIIEETKLETEHLESIAASLETVTSEADIDDIKKEMTEAGYIRAKKGASKKSGAKKPGAVKSVPLHYISSDGFDMYVGKNNYQNENITFRLADGSDWWFHAKKIPGSHVIVKSGGKELPDRAFEEAASLAAHYSKAGGADKAEVDYVQRKFVKKPAGAKPGYVIYHTNYSMTAPTDISRLTQVK